MFSEANKDEVLKCRRVAEKALQEGNKEKAIRFLEKALRMDPQDASVQVLLQRARSFSGPAQERKQPAARDQETRERRQHASEGEASTRPFTPEQAKEVQRIRRLTDHYQVLGVSRDATDDAIKKAYKKAALKMHPDKNAAPGSAEAFKKISTAFQCLNDPRKRSLYDQYGHEDDAPQRVRHRYRENMMEPQDLFEAFINGLIGGHHTQQNRPMDGVNLRSFIGVIVILISLLSFSTRPPAANQMPFRFSRQGAFVRARTSGGMKIPYYLHSEREKEYESGSVSSRKLDRYVEKYYLDNLQTDCTYAKHVARRNHDIAKMRHKPKEELDKILGKPLPACEEMKKLQQNFPKAFKRAQEYNEPFY